MAAMREYFTLGWGRTLSYKPLAILFPPGDVWNEYVEGGVNPNAAGFTQPSEGFTIQRIPGTRVDQNQFPFVGMLKTGAVDYASTANNDGYAVDEEVVLNIAASGVQYFKHIVITWSIRSRGSVHRTQIITVTPTTPLKIKFTQPARLARYPVSRNAVSPSA